MSHKICHKKISSHPRNFCEDIVARFTICNFRACILGDCTVLLRLNGEVLEEVESLKYLGSAISRGGGVNKDVRQRVSEGLRHMGR